jgi:hypothetical protein
MRARPSAMATSTARPHQRRSLRLARQPPPRQNRSSPPTTKNRRALPLQTRRPLSPRHRQLPPRHLPRRGRQAPPPTQARIDDALPQAPHDHHPARAPAPLLCPADDHRAGIGEHQDTTEARLPLKSAPRLLHPPQRSRAQLPANIQASTPGDTDQTPAPRNDRNTHPDGPEPSLQTPTSSPAGAPHTQRPTATHAGRPQT